MSSSQKYLVAAGGLVLVAAVAAGVFLLGRDGEEKPPAAAESTSTVDTTASVEPTPTTDAADSEPKPSYERYAYVRAVTGEPDNYEASLDFFDILTGDAAEQYAASKGLTPPSNGILYANEDETVESVPLSRTVVIRYATGGVESLTMTPATVAQLQSWAEGDTGALPGADRDMWEVTVRDGVVTHLEMVVIAD
jgi:hypothetical protein